MHAGETGNHHINRVRAYRHRGCEIAAARIGEHDALVARLAADDGHQRAENRSIVGVGDRTLDGCDARTRLRRRRRADGDKQ